LMLQYELELALVLEWGLELVLEFVWGVQVEVSKRGCCGFLSFHLLMK
jgi:hypothetical protein